MVAVEEPEGGTSGEFCNGSGTDDNDLGRRNAGDTAQDNTLSVIGCTQVFRSYQQYRTTRNFAHSPDNGHSPYLVLNILVRQRNNLLLQHCLQYLDFQLAHLHGRYQRLAWMNHLNLLQRGRFDLQNYVGFIYFLGGVNNLRPGIDVFFIWKFRPKASFRLNPDLMTIIHQDSYCVWGKANAIFLQRYFTG